LQLVRPWFGLLAAAVLSTTALAAPTPPSVNDLGRAAKISDVSIAPDGNHLAALTSPDGVSLNISVWPMGQLSGNVVTIGSTHMRFLAVRFLKSDRLLVTAVQPFTTDEGKAGHLVKSYVTDLTGKSFDPLLPDHALGHSTDVQDYNRLVEAELVSTLPQDPRHVLVEDHRIGSEGDIYSVDVYSLEAGRVMQGADRFFGYQVDLKGVLRARHELNFENGKVYIAQQIRNPDTGAWEEHFRSFAKDRISTDVVGFTTDPNVVLIATSKGADKTGIFEYDIKQRKILEPAFEHKLFEAAPEVIISHAPGDFGRPLGFAYQAETSKIYWLDPRMDSIFKALSQSLGVSSETIDWTDPGTGLKSRLPVALGADLRFDGASDDMKYILIEKSGPRQPPEYYLLTDGSKLALLGKSRPWIDTAALGETHLVQYAARDGLLIPAFLTTPPKAVFGPGPYPTLIEPHGGPWARDDMDWDIAGWVQYFASRGYAVLQPQFRGSEGWGQKLWRAGDGEWGQKMQDDNDDGVKWLIAQGIADPKRVAIFGYSYGGYAALAASIRPNGLYQCAISGAGAGDLEKIGYATADNRYEREFQHPTIGGLDVLKHASEATIPVMLYHGDRDQTVDVEESRKFAAALRAARKPYRYIEIKDMGHQFVFMTPAMVQEQLTDIDAFLKTDCKPGGL
jgi:dipeptidyl aminopeptidase/acylaminoacyl peptidase